MILNKIRKKTAIILTTLTGIFGFSSVFAASSTVMIDTPDIADIVDKIYQVANPLFDSISGWIWFIVAFIFVFFLVRLFLGKLFR